MNADRLDIRGELLGLEGPERTIRRLAFAALLDGRTPPLASLAQEAGVAVDRGRALAERGVFVLDDEERVVAAAGLSLVPARQHRLALAGRDYWTWCAIDTLGIAAALDADAEIDTTCQWCERPIHLRLERGRVAEATVSDPRLWNQEHERGRSLSGET